MSNISDIINGSMNSTMIFDAEAMGLPFASSTFLGNPIYNLLFSVLIIIGTAILAKIIFFIVTTTFKRFSAKTKTEVDDLLIASLQKPFTILIVIFGLRFAMAFLTFPGDYGKTINNMIDILLTLDLAWIAIGVINSLLEGYVKKVTANTKSKLDDQIVPVLKKVTIAIVLLFALLSILTNFGYDVTAILGGLGIAGLAVAMAAQHALGDVLGGVAIFSSRPFELGDAINADGVSGTVTEVGMRATKVKSFNGTLVTIPNSKIGNAIVENYTKSDKRRVRFNIGLVYESSVKDLEKAKKILLKIVDNTEGTEKGTGSVLFMEFGDSALNLMFTYYVLDTARLFDIQDEVNMQIKKEFDKAKLDFAFPSHTVYMKK